MVSAFPPFIVTYILKIGKPLETDDNVSSTESAMVGVSEFPPPRKIRGNSVYHNAEGETDERLSDTPTKEHNQRQLCWHLEGTTVINAIKYRNADWNNALGDLGY